MRSINYLYRIPDHFVRENNYAFSNTPSNCISCVRVVWGSRVSDRSTIRNNWYGNISVTLYTSVVVAKPFFGSLKSNIELVVKCAESNK